MKSDKKLPAFMAKKVAKEEVKGHETRMHKGAQKYADGGRVKARATATSRGKAC
jgi:hypothetical protein